MPNSIRRPARVAAALLVTVAAGCVHVNASVSRTAGSPASDDAGSRPFTVFLVRHAEKAVGGGGDPALSDAGALRALALRDSLRGAPVAAIFTSEYRRTRDTARPLADALGIAPAIVRTGGGIDAHVAAVADSVRARAMAGRAVLVVGHANTVPLIIRALGGPALAELCDSQYGDLFVLELPADGAPRLTSRRVGAAIDAPGCAPVQGR